MNFLFFYLWPMLNIIFSMVYNPPESVAENKPKIIRNFLSGVNVCSISLLGILYYLTNYKCLFDLSIIISFSLVSHL